ncbi:MAG: hypothetical protein ACUVXJ_10170, partial [Phycisphaerae bacterium]
MIESKTLIGWRPAFLKQEQYCWAMFEQRWACDAELWQALKSQPERRSRESSLARQWHRMPSCSVTVQTPVVTSAGAGWPVR